jgi:hypothetical protein
VPAPTAPCGWDPIPCGCELPGYGDDEESGVEPDPSVVYAVETAQFVMWALSGRQFGACELTLRPCRRDCRSGAEGPWGARLVDGSWVNLPCRSCGTRCSCVDVCEVRLPFAPAGEVVSVVFDGEELEADQYWLEDSEWLVLATSAGCWPDCQDMSVSLGEAGTYGVTYTQGVAVPTAGKRAVGALACEILKACSNDSSCCLPKRTQSYNRQGMSVVLIDPMEFFDKGRTGIYEVDLFLNAVNPEGRPSGARVMSPDSEPRMRNVWP